MGNVHGVARPPRLLSAATALALSLLFIAVYGFTGWLTSLRPNVGTWSFEWEQNIPLVPWLIVPYMSLDPFFIAAPFLCAHRGELTALGRRLTLAILVSGIVFLTMPLRCTFPLPQPSGWTGAIFRTLHSFDRPYNLFPSLHISIWMILSGVYHRHTAGHLRWLTHAWFILIAVSTVFTHQHHVIDVAGGLVLGLFCYYLVPEDPRSQPRTTDARLGTLYICGAALVAAAGVWTRPWGGLLLWPAASMTIVAGAYWGLNGVISRKDGGRLPVSARIVLAPWLAGQQASLMYYRRQAAAWSVIAPGVWIGRQLNEREAEDAVRHGVTAVLDLTAEFSEPSAFVALPYLNLPILDLTAPREEQLRTALAFINTHRHRGTVYVHCKIGYSRSAAVVGSWLMDAGLVATADVAVAKIRAVRPTLVVRPEALAALQAFERRDAGVSRAARPLIEARV